MPELFNTVFSLQVMLFVMTLMSAVLLSLFVKQKGLLFAALHHDELLNDENNGMSKQIAALKDQNKILQSLNDQQDDLLLQNVTTIEYLENEVRFLRDQQNSKSVTSIVVDGVPVTVAKQLPKRRNRNRGNHPGVGKSIP